MKKYIIKACGTASEVVEALKALSKAHNGATLRTLQLLKDDEARGQAIRDDLRGALGDNSPTV